MNQPKVVLTILDGWGYSPIRRGNAIAQANKPNFDHLWQYYPHTLIEASGQTAGLSWGVMGGSEVGHFCIGSGRIIYHDLPKISKAINSGEFFKNPAILGALNHAKKNKSNLHFVGLTSAGGVHSHIDHLFALFNLLKMKHFRRPSFVQMFTDGRDVPIKSAEIYVDKINQEILRLHLKTKIASVMGRFYAMDRDSRWDRTFAAYNCMVNGSGRMAFSAKEAVEKAYQEGQTDEFIKPVTIVENQDKKGQSNSQQKPVGLIQDNDAVIFFNFRPERMRQIMETFLFPQNSFPDKKMLKNLYIATMVEYDKSLPVAVAVQTERVQNSLAKIISDNGLSQLHIAETEKYAHITYFFDGGQTTPNKNEDWVAVPSPKVETYDLKPEMSADKITQKIFTLCSQKNYDFILINFANTDMVGHTANFKAGILAVEAVDRQLGKLTQRFPESAFLITADHGNAEEMIDYKTGEKNSEHSVRPVPFILADPGYRKEAPDSLPLRSTNILADIAPTVLDLLNLPIPEEMTGCSMTKTIV